MIQKTLKMCKWRYWKAAVAQLYLPNLDVGIEPNKLEENECQKNIAFERYIESYNVWKLKCV